MRDDATGDLRTTITVVAVDVSDKEITTRNFAKGPNPPRTVVYNLDWGRIDDSVWKYRPSDIGIKTPLQVGKEWRSEADATNMQNGAGLRTSGVAKVVGQEQITTAAGTFDTYRIDVTVRQVDTKDQTKSSTVTQVIWYAESINRWVKKKTEARSNGRVRESYADELTAYIRKS